MITTGQCKTTNVWLLVIGAAVTSFYHCSHADDARDRSAPYMKRDTWQQTMLACRGKPGVPEQISGRIRGDFPIEWDWFSQDCGSDFRRWFDNRTDTGIEQTIIATALAELGPAAKGLRGDFETLCESGASADDPRWLDLYVTLLLC